MPRIHEISGPISHAMWDYNVLDPSGGVLPPVAILPAATIASQGYDAHSLQLTTLSGTYVETAAHLFPGRRTLNEVPLDELLRPAKVLHLPPADPRTLIHAAHLAAHAPHLLPGDALLIATGWGAHWNQPDYISHCPSFASDALAWLQAQPFSILGVDTPCIDCNWAKAAGREDEAGPVLKPLYQHREMLLLAPLVHLEDIHSDHGRLIALPLNITGVCSAPCRAIFIEGDD
jgi:kynurenine formamidase